MGVMNHNAVLATAWNQKLIDKAMLWINELPEIERELFITGQGVANGETTICLIPDGSKEGWRESNTGDALRARFIAMLEGDKYEDGSSCWSWIEVGYGEYGQKVLRGNNTNCYNYKEYASEIGA